jgi:hypothetical protein
MWSSLPDSVISHHGRKSIKEAYSKVEGKAVIQNAFIEAFTSLNVPSLQPTSDSALRAIHDAMVKYIFLAYAGMRWDNKYGEEKRKAGSKHNVSHRTNIQYVENGAGKGGDSNGSYRRKRRMPSSSLLKDFADCVATAQMKLQTNGYVVAAEGPYRLTKKEH